MVEHKGKQNLHNWTEKSGTELFLTMKVINLDLRYWATRKRPKDEWRHLNENCLFLYGTSPGSHPRCKS